MDARRKRLLYQSRHRGTKEADILLGGFAVAHVADLDETLLADFEALLDEGDNDLVNWILGREAPPERLKSVILERLIAGNRGG